MAVEDSPSVPTRRAGDRYRELRRWAIAETNLKIARALQIETLKAAGFNRERMQVTLKLEDDEFRRAYAWYMEAVGESRMSRDFRSIESALRAHGERHVELIIRLAAMKQENPRVTRQQLRAHLRLSEGDLDTILRWYRNGQVAVHDRLTEAGRTVRSA